MKRLLALLVAALCLTVPAIAENPYIVTPRIDPEVYNPNIDTAARRYIDPESEADEESPLDDLPHVSAGNFDLEDFTFQYDTVYGALPLINIIANVVDRSSEFTGAPNASAAWQAIHRFLTTQARPDGGAFDFGLRDGKIPAENVTAVYDMLFAYGRIPQRAEEAVSWIARDGDSYALEAFEADHWRAAYVNGVASGAADDLIVDITVLNENALCAQEFFYNAQIALLPDPYALYGARIAGIAIRDVRPNFTSAEAIYGMGEAHNNENGAMNVLDGDAGTCWMFDPELNASITINAVGTQTVRGLCLLPFDASSDDAMRRYGRVKSLRVTLSNGNIFEKTFDDFTSPDQWACVPFEGVHPVNWARIEILDAFPGDLNDEACVSDLYFY